MNIEWIPGARDTRVCSPLPAGCSTRKKSVVEKKRNNRNENCAITLRYDECWNVPTFTICYRALLERIWVENVGKKTRLNPEWTQFCHSIKLQWAAWNFLYELSDYVENIAEHSHQTKQQDTRGFSRLLKIQITNKTHLDKVWLNFQLMWNFFSSSRASHVDDLSLSSLHTLEKAKVPSRIDFHSRKIFTVELISSWTLDRVEFLSWNSKFNSLWNKKKGLKAGVVSININFRFSETQCFAK